jgi:hypothetical protein
MSKSKTCGYPKDVIQKLEQWMQKLRSDPKKYREEIQENIWRMTLDILDCEKKAKEETRYREKEQSLKMVIELRSYRKRLSYLL